MTIKGPQASQTIIEKRLMESDLIGGNAVNSLELELNNKGENLLREVKPQLTGVKYDNNKPDVSLLPPEALLEIAKVFDFGKGKYSAHNWRGGFVWTRISSAVLRHIYAWLKGEDKDPESGLSHLAHAACGLMFLLTFEVTKKGEDDRYKA